MNQSAWKGQGGGFRWLRRLAVAALLLASVGTAHAEFVSAPARSQNSLPRRGRLDTSRYPAERARLLTAEQQRAFPNLKQYFEVVAPSTPTYNCIANSLGIRDTWINPVTGPPENRMADMDRMYANAGYRRVATLDFRPEPGKRKVVVYATMKNGAVAQVTHAAIQQTDGVWLSKLGKLSLIRHQSPLDLAGPNYGRPVAVYTADR